MRNYTSLDLLLRFKKFAQQHQELNGLEFIKLYNIEFPELSSKEKLLNLAKAMRIPKLYKAISGNDLPEEEPDLSELTKEAKKSGRLDML